MKNSTKLIIGLGVFAAATAAVTYAVVRELKAIRNLTIDMDDVPDEEMDDLMIEEPEAEETDEIVEEAAEVSEEEPVAEEEAEEKAEDEAVAE